MLGHIRAGHTRLRWLIAPSLIVPFLGMALSRAREYTSGRIGAAGAGDRDGAVLGLTILAAAHVPALEQRPGRRIRYGARHRRDEPVTPG